MSNRNNRSRPDKNNAAIDAIEITSSMDSSNKHQSTGHIKSNNFGQKIRYDKITWREDGFALTKKGDLYGLLDQNGLEIIAPTYILMDGMFWVKGLYAEVVRESVKKVHTYGLINKMGQEVIPSTYYFFDYLNVEKGRLVAQTSMGWIIIDFRNSQITPAYYDEFITKDYSVSDSTIKAIRNGVQVLVNVETGNEVKERI